jgi:hypothetical protein
MLSTQGIFQLICVNLSAPPETRQAAIADNDWQSW